MATNDTTFIEAFSRFWNFVDRAEQDIWQNGHRGRLPPDCHGDPWDDEFAAAYESVVPLLKKFQQERFFEVPVGLALFSGPLQAETAHQALMFFLNPSKELYGEKGPLDSPQYLAIKDAAMKEISDKDKARISGALKKRPSSSARLASELIELRAFIFDHHFPKDGGVRTTTLTSKEIESHFNWSQPTVSRKMGKIFQSDKGMKVYGVVFGTHTSDAGYCKRLEDLTLSVDAIWNDRRPDEDEGVMNDNDDD